MRCSRWFLRVPRRRSVFPSVGGSRQIAGPVPDSLRHREGKRLPTAGRICLTSVLPSVEKCLTPAHPELSIAACPECCKGSTGAEKTRGNGRHNIHCV